jgi:hypothetical protein
MKELEITRRTEERKQIFGRLAGKAAIADDFDAPLPDELLNEFEGESASIRIECKIDELRMSRVIECDEANNPSFGVDGQLPIRE